MRTRLASSFTFVWKILFPPLWIGGFSIGTIAVTCTKGPAGLVFLIGTILGATFMYHTSMQAKVVSSIVE